MVRRRFLHHPPPPHLRTRLTTTAACDGLNHATWAISAREVGSDALDHTPRACSEQQQVDEGSPRAGIGGLEIRKLSFRKPAAGSASMLIPRRVVTSRRGRAPPYATPAPRGRGVCPTSDLWMVEKIFRQSAEFCSEHDLWKLNVAHVFFWNSIAAFRLNARGEEDAGRDAS